MPFCLSLHVTLCFMARWEVPYLFPGLGMSAGNCFIHAHSGYGYAVRALESVLALKDLRTVVLTHLTPKRMASVKALLERRSPALFGAGPLDMYLSNPALQLLRSSLGALLRHAPGLLLCHLKVSAGPGSIHLSDVHCTCCAPAWARVFTRVPGL